MKLKNLRKKIRRLEARLQEGPKKLAKLKRKLAAIATADGGKAKRKSAARAGETRQTVKSSTPTEKKRRRLIAKPQVKPASAERPSVAKKVKRKLNLSPERRAQLVAAMKARWAAKRAAAEKRDETKKVKRKLNLSPERRAQLAAAMKARWAAKRAAAEANPQNTSTDQDFMLRQAPQVP